MRSEGGRHPFRDEAGTDRRRYALWYVQHQGSRSYIRVTGLGLLTAALFTLIPALLILTLFFRNEAQQRQELENVNINVRTAPPAPGNYPQLIKAPPPAAMPTPPKAGRSPRGGEPVRQTPATPGVNTNTPPTLIPTPSPSPPSPPG
jgi:hypothetical protein